jgi:hypothetical protein
MAIDIAGTLTENRDSGCHRTWWVYLAVLAALLTVVSAVAGTEYLGRVVGIADGDTFTLLVGREHGTLASKEPQILSLPSATGIVRPIITHSLVPGSHARNIQQGAHTPFAESPPSA